MRRKQSFRKPGKADTRKPTRKPLTVQDATCAVCFFIPSECHDHNCSWKGPVSPCCKDWIAANHITHRSRILRVQHGAFRTGMPSGCRLPLGVLLALLLGFYGWRLSCNSVFLLQRQTRQGLDKLGSRFTLLTISHGARSRELRSWVRHYSRCPSVKEILVIWNKGRPPQVSGQPLAASRLYLSALP